MALEFNPLEYPQCLQLPARLNPLARHEHIPFVKVLIQMLRPRSVVKLGVYRGDTYLAICEAVAALGMKVTCHGIDTWKGDLHGGLNDPKCLNDLRVFHDPPYGQFSTLVQSTFDEAATHFLEGSIELLHIDGLHTFEAVAHDWELWRSKLNRNAVVLFQDTNLREEGSGVWRLWEQVRGNYRHFEFLHGRGLGVLALSHGIPESLNGFLTLAEKNPAMVRNFFYALGNRVTMQAKLGADRNTIEVLEARIPEFDQRCHEYAEDIKKLERLGQERADEIDKLQARIDDFTKTVAARNAEIQAQKDALDKQRDVLDKQQAQLDKLQKELTSLRDTNEQLAKAKDAGGSKLSKAFKFLKGK